MALSAPFRSSSLISDPFHFFSEDPFAISLKIFDTEPAFSYAKDVHAVANTRIDWKETDDAHIISADLPGLTKEEVKIELVDSSTLRISGERCKEEVKETDKWHRVERASGKFLRSFRLPDNTDKGSINAKLENGVLVISVPKVKAKAPEVKSIAIAGDAVPAAPNSQ